MPPLLNYPATPRRIYVHASKTFADADSGWEEYVHKRVSAEIWQTLWNTEFLKSLPLGSIIGEVDIVGCKYHFGEELDNLYSVWHEVGMYGLLLANPVLYDKPIPCKGKLGFFEPDIPLQG